MQRFARHLHPFLALLEHNRSAERAPREAWTAMTANDQNIPTAQFRPRYTVLERLGEGGIGTVYKVRDEQQGTVRALKALKSQRGASPRDITRFEDEYRILHSLHHPTLPQVSDFGMTTDGSRYLVMEYIEGHQLDQFISENPSQLWPMIYQLVEALSFIHQHKLLHLDLKPANLLVTQTVAASGNSTPLLKLIDFGISYQRDEGRETEFAGTPAYMPPEIINGDAELTRAADYYSLGITLYEIVFGKIPYSGTYDEVIAAHLNDTVTCNPDEAIDRNAIPHIKALTARSRNERLIGFEELGRAVAARYSTAPHPLDDAFAMGYLDSFGMIGKDEVWPALRSWALSLGQTVGEPLAEWSHPVATVAKSNLETQDLPGSRTPSPERAAQDTVAMSAKSTEESRPTVTSSPDVARSVLVSGPKGSGKSHVVNALRAELALRGLATFAIHDDREYRAWFKNTPAEHGDMIDRFVAGWDQLKLICEHRGVVVIVDGVESLAHEEREFFTYVSRRLGHEIESGQNPAIHVLVTGRSPRLRDSLSDSLPAASAQEYLIPPPRSRDLDAVMNQFAGHMQGTLQRETLRRHLSRSAETVEALLSRLKTSLLHGNLTRTSGDWDFVAPGDDDRNEQDGGDNYYFALYAQLSAEERSLLGALACHVESLTLALLTTVTGLSADQVHTAAQRLAPYRLIDAELSGSANRFNLASDALREALYQVIPHRDRIALHNRFVECMTARDETRHNHHFLSHHYAHAGLARHALVEQVHRLNELEQQNDLFAIRELCAGALDHLRDLRGNDWAARRWHIERFFICRWIAAEWRTSNFSAIVDIVHKHITGRRRQVPLSLCYSYGMALQKVGDYTASSHLLRGARRRGNAIPPLAEARLSVLEANQAFGQSDYTKALEILQAINLGVVAHDPALLTQVHVLFMSSYDGVGDKAQHERYLRLASDVAETTGNHEQLLSIKYSVILSYLHSSSYARAKNELISAIRLASRERHYDKLSSMYFLASAVYYEEGAYLRALRYLDKSVRVAVNLGLTHRVTDYTLRYAFIYQNLGQYGHAMRHAEMAKRRATEQAQTNQYFFALLILLDLGNCTNDPKAAQYVRELTSLAGGVKAKYQLSWYHRLLGEHHFLNGDEDSALDELQTAARMYQSIEFDDDAARCLIRMAFIYTRRGDERKSAQLLRRVEDLVYRMESEDVTAESYMAHLEHYRVFAHQRHMFMGMLKLCEDVRPRICDVNIAVRMDAILVRCYRQLHESDKFEIYLQSYCERISDIVKSLGDEDLSLRFLAQPEVNELLKEYRARTKKTPEPLLV